jgi:YVTN family beta-propeller protein
MNRPGENLRRSAVFAAVIAAFALAAGSAGAAPLAFTANLGTNTVSTINTATNAIFGKSIPVGSEPSSIAYTPDGKRAYVANADDGTISVIDIALRSIVGAPIPVGKGLATIAIAPNGLTAYVTSRESDKVTAIDTRTNTVIGSVVTIEKPYAVAISTDGRSLYVGSNADSAVYVVDPQTLAVVGGPIAVGEDPSAIVFTPDGRTAYVADHSSDEVSAIDTATGESTPIPTHTGPWGLAMTPDGRKLFVSDEGAEMIEVIDPATNEVIDEIPVGKQPFELGMAPDGKTVYVAEAESEAVLAIDTATDEVIGKPIEIKGGVPWQVTVAPDQSPTAAFTPPSASLNVPAAFSGAASTDPDGSVVSWNWAFGDGGTAAGVTASHTYGSPGSYDAKLSVVDNEGCGEAEVFTGRTALCGGGGSATHPIAVAAPSIVPIAAPAPSNRFKFGRLIHNTRNGTARLQVKMPAAGSIVLFGKKVHMVRKKIGAAGSLWLTVHARVELNKQLKKIHRKTVKVRITFTPTGGTAKSVSRSITLLHAARKK